jgi:3',5'-cyclic AMP phosphodiesterase CpdA
MGRAALAILAGLLLAAAPAAAMTRTTVERTILDTDADNRLETAPGEDYGPPRQELGTATPGRTRTRQRLLFFGQMTDTHVVDEESPLRVEFLDKFRGPFTSAYRPQEGLSPQVLNEMAEQLRNTTSPVSPSKQIELVMTTGDNTDNTQCNETRWMIDVLDGQRTINPDSGLLAGETLAGSNCAVGPPAPAVPVPPTCTARATPDDRYDGVRGDHEYYEPDASDGEDGQGYSPRQAENGRSSEVRDFPGLFQRMNEPFRATGLQKVPWYAVFGNHDGLVQGNQPRNMLLEALAVGCLKPTNLPSGTVEDIQTALENGDEQAALAILQNALTTQGGASTTVVPPDPRRRPLRKHEWIAEHFVTNGFPAGHGFQHRPASLVDGQGYYHFDHGPRVRMIALDTVAEHGLEEGNIDETQFQWLHQRLLEADDQQRYSLLFAHHSLRTMGQPPVSPFPTTADQGGDHNPDVHYGLRTRLESQDRPCLLQDNETPPYPDETLKCLLLRHPSAIGFVNGHEHANRITPFPRDPEAGPVEGGFWEINTASHIDWPQQARVIDVFDNHDGTLSLFGTIVDHAAPPEPGGPDAPRSGQGQAGSAVTRMASISRELSFNDTDASHNDTSGDGGARGSRADRNQELVVRDPFTP